MNKTVLRAIAATVATLSVPATVLAAEAAQGAQAATDTVAPTAKATVGKVLYSADGRRVASIYRVNADGAAQVIVDGKLVTVPASTLSDTDGKVVTSLTKRELVRAR